MAPTVAHEEVTVALDCIKLQVEFWPDRCALRKLSWLYA
jgi:hypothetical protein